MRGLQEINAANEVAALRERIAQLSDENALQRKRIEELSRENSELRSEFYLPMPGQWKAKQMTLPFSPYSLEDVRKAMEKK
jgi:hypothetical protein